MYKILFLIFVILFLSSCNKHSDITKFKPNKSSNYIYQEKPFELKWKIEKNSITKIPVEVHKKIKIICMNHNRFVLIKIKTFKDDTALGTFDCRI
tara:strand:- start:201 stop:485 length:285 start_codon:yes stop_codon:yes gene_type:complete